MPFANQHATAIGQLAIAAGAAGHVTMAKRLAELAGDIEDGKTTPKRAADVLDVEACRCALVAKALSAMCDEIRKVEAVCRKAGAS